MRAIGVTEFGGSEKLHEVELPERHPGPGEVRVRVTACAVNATDTYVPTGMLAFEPVKQFPYVPGMDVAGLVDEVGDAVDSISVGDRVMGLVVPHQSHGGYSESVVLPSTSVVHAPAGCSDAEASTLPMNALTARLALDRLALGSDDPLAVTGAAGSVGGYCVQLAKADGLQVIADASRADRDLVCGLGADTVLDRGEDVAARIREHMPHGVAGLVDGAVLDERALPAVRDGGAMVTLRGWRGQQARGIILHPISILEYAENRAALERIREQVEAGLLTPRVATVMPASQAARAHAMLAAGGVRGRIVLTWD